MRPSCYPLKLLCLSLAILSNNSFSDISPTAITQSSETSTTKISPLVGQNMAFLSSLSDNLKRFGYNSRDLTVGENHALFITAKEDKNYGLLARAVEVIGHNNQQLGLYSSELPFLVFTDVDNTVKQTYFYPMLSPLILKAFAEQFPNITIESSLDGTVKLTFVDSGSFSFWRAGYVVTSSSQNAGV
ncbi:MAG: hypothetical protein RL368_921, partial [Pseudomonadota bacterium]